MNGAVGGKRRALRAALIMACALGLLFAMSGSALAKKHKHKPKKPSITPTTAITKGSGYLALGDSVTFGYEEQQVVPAPNYGDASSFIAYPELLGKELHLTVANAACAGETSSSLIDSTAPSNGCENSPNGGPAYRTMFPLHVSYSGSQLAYAVSYLKKHKNVRLVSLMIGANDFFVCQETTADHCASFTEQAGVIGTVEKNVATILTAIRKQAKYNGQIVIVNYYALNYADPTAVQQSGLLNSSIDNAAKPFHVETADGFGQFQAGAAHSGGSSCTAGLLTQLTGASSPCGIHPSYAGQSLLAQAVANAIRIG
ncbi:MAG TPA: SGNH/GDSL hydrolase family protein [Solirubrobacteraceae bacterium]|nr:SGNH/GDSL hydrolase family protein [Solirubrobacteraceae bacterium]